ncbi:type 1 glutamine amidotransferase [Halobaculum sp. MBLA0147]|uniref:type 1 glutamine amidotransferase n=1 Tax=Halobaculum sp. MBLA0147 TaxID=3079934 RepID=UPI0035266FFC
MAQAIAVVDASLGDTPAERNLTREIDTRTDVYKASEGRIPPSPTASKWDYSGIVISGSQTAVYDDADWIHELTEWFRQVHRSGVPTLGICWGHQFIAQALGGRVVDMGQYEIGYQPVRRLGTDPLFDDIPQSFTAFQTHSDRVAELPCGAVELAHNDYGIQAFRVDHSYGVQFHPEYDRQTAEWVVEGKDFSQDRIQALQEEITEAAVDEAAVAARVFDNFVSLTETHQPTRQSCPTC